MRPRLLDLFCGAGGAAMGYHRAGFDVVGVDIEPQPHYPFEFHQGDALDYVWQHWTEFDAIHASPPCQAYSVTRTMHEAIHPELVSPVRDMLRSTRLPYVIENVVGAPLLEPIRLCGSSFGLRVWRHRLFEMSDPPAIAPVCSHYHHPLPLDITGTGGPGGRHRKPRGLATAREAMGIDWMTRVELSEAIPPAYTEWIGAQLLRVVQENVA